MEPCDEVKPYPRGTVVHCAENDYMIWVRTDIGWKRVNVMHASIADSAFTDKHVFVGAHQFGYIITLPPGEEY